MSTLVIATANVFPSGRTVMAQRAIVGTTTSVPLSGTYTGSVPVPEANWQGGAYVPLTSLSASGGNWSGVFPGQLKGSGALIVRDANATAVNDTCTLKLGDIWHIPGDSTAHFAPNSGVSGDVWEYDKSGAVWFLTSSNGTSQWPYLMQQLYIDQSCPQMYVPTMVSGTRLLTGWQQGQTNYVNAVAACLASKASGFRGNLAQLTCNDVQFGGTPSAAAIAAGWLNFATGFAADLPRAPPTFNWMWSELPFTAWGGNTATFRSNVDDVRQGDLDAVTAGSIFMGGNLTGRSYSDGEHPSTDADKQLIANQFWTALKTFSYGGGPYRGPRLVSATLDTTSKIVRVTLDQTLGNSISSSVSGFRVMDSGASVTITSQIITNARVITLTLPSAVVGVCTVSFASSQDAIDGTLPTSAAITLPDPSLGVTTVTIPAEPFFNASTSAYVALGGVARSRMQLCM